MLHQLENITMTDLHTQIAEWSRRNFGDRQASDLGVVEELGEACHGLLKRMQGIRGFDDDTKYREHMADCFADMGVYLLNYAAVNGVMLHGFAEYDLALGYNDRRAITQILMGTSLVVEFADTYGAVVSDEQPPEVKTQLQGLLQKVWEWVGSWAKYHGFDFRNIVTATWIKVRQRDWAKNKTHAHVIAENGGVEVPRSDIGSVPPEPGAIHNEDIPRHLRDRSTEQM